MTGVERIRCCQSREFQLNLKYHEAEIRFADTRLFDATTAELLDRILESSTLIVNRLFVLLIKGIRKIRKDSNLPMYRTTLNRKFVHHCPLSEAH